MASVLWCTRSIAHENLSSDLPRNQSTVGSVCSFPSDTMLQMSSDGHDSMVHLQLQAQQRDARDTLAAQPMQAHQVLPRLLCRPLRVPHQLGLTSNFACISATVLDLRPIMDTETRLQSPWLQDPTSRH